MIRNIIFDFGDVFINLDKGVLLREIQRREVFHLLPEFDVLNKSFEVGAITSDQFLTGLKELMPDVDKAYLEKVWNGMLLDFPEHRLEFIEKLSKKSDYRLFLLSNTNSLHIPHVIRQMGKERYFRFKNSFEKFYLSHEIGLRKPSAEVYEFVLSKNELQPSETLFIDDTEENTRVAATLGIKTWNLKVGQEDVTHLNTKI